MQRITKFVSCIGLQRTQHHRSQTEAHVYISTSLNLHQPMGSCPKSISSGSQEAPLCCPEPQDSHLSWADGIVSSSTLISVPVCHAPRGAALCCGLGALLLPQGVFSVLLDRSVWALLVYEKITQVCICRARCSRSRTCCKAAL